MGSCVNKEKLVEFDYIDNNHSIFSLAAHSKESELHLQHLWIEFCRTMALSDEEIEVPYRTQTAELDQLSIVAGILRPI